MRKIINTDSLLPPLPFFLFSGIDCAVQCQPKQTKVKDAIYKLRNPVQQIESFVGDVVRAHVPKVREQKVENKLYILWHATLAWLCDWARVLEHNSVCCSS